MLKNTDFIEDSQFEHRFWHQILGDHSRFIYSNLAPIEAGMINQAHHFIFMFDESLNRARSKMDAPLWIAFTGEIIPEVEANCDPARPRVSQ